MKLKTLRLSLCSTIICIIIRERIGFYFRPLCAVKIKPLQRFYAGGLYFFLCFLLFISRAFGQVCFCPPIILFPRPMKNRKPLKQKKDRKIKWARHRKIKIEIERSDPGKILIAGHICFCFYFLLLPANFSRHFRCHFSFCNFIRQREYFYFNSGPFLPPFLRPFILGR